MMSAGDWRQLKIGGCSRSRARRSPPYHAGAGHPPLDERHTRVHAALLDLLGLVIRNMRAQFAEARFGAFAVRPAAHASYEHDLQPPALLFIVGIAAAHLFDLQSADFFTITKVRIAKARKNILQTAKKMFITQLESRKTRTNSRRRPPRNDREHRCEPFCPKDSL